MGFIRMGFWLLIISIEFHPNFRRAIASTRAITSITAPLISPDDICSLDEDCPLTEKCSKAKCVSSCSKITCGFNEGCQVNNDHTSFCRCLPNFYRYDITHECKLPYQWVEFMKNQLVNGSRLVTVFENIVHRYVVARLMGENNDVYPLEGKISNNNHTFRDFAGRLKNYNNAEVLLIKSGKAKWILSSNGAILNNAIVLGKIGNETIHACRVGSDPYFYIGLMQPSTKSCNNFYDNRMISDYDILIHEMYPIQ